MKQKDFHLIQKGLKEIRETELDEWRDFEYGISSIESDLDEKRINLIEEFLKQYDSPVCKKCLSLANFLKTGYQCRLYALTAKCEDTKLEVLHKESKEFMFKKHIAIKRINGESLLEKDIEL